MEVKSWAQVAPVADSCVARKTLTPRIQPFVMLDVKKKVKPDNLLDENCCVKEI